MRSGGINRRQWPLWVRDVLPLILSYRQQCTRRPCSCGGRRSMCQRPDSCSTSWTNTWSSSATNTTIGTEKDMWEERMIDIAQALGGPLQWRACESRRTRPSSDPKLHRTYGSLGEDDEYIINEWKPSQEELDSTVSRAWCTYMYYNEGFWNERNQTSTHVNYLQWLFIMNKPIHIVCDRSTNSFRHVKAGQFTSEVTAASSAVSSLYDQDYSFRHVKDGSVYVWR
jgi:hypothetical protein